METIKSGTFLTKKGQKLASQFNKAIPSQCTIQKCKTTKGKYNYAILLSKDFVSDLGNGMQQRDYAILYGASDSLTLIYNKNNFVFAGDKMTCFSNEVTVRDYLIDKLEPKKGDIVIITSSDDKFVAEISAINTALWTLNN